MFNIHLGHHFFGAGNIGDDLMLAGFLACVKDQHLGKAHFTCCIPHNIRSQRKRFPEIEWLAYSQENREQAISRSDLWLGLGGSPFQSDVSDWFINHLCEELEICRQHAIPMWYLGIGVNDRNVFEQSKAVELLNQAEHIWARDSFSQTILKTYSEAPDRISLGADFSHYFLKNYTCTFLKGSLGFCLNSNNQLTISEDEVAEVFSDSQFKTASWYIQEIRNLPNTEEHLFSQLRSSIQSKMQRQLPDYNAVNSLSLLKAWHPAEVLISSRYHASIIHAWAGSRIGVVSINDKLEGIAKELSLPSFSSLSEIKAQDIEKLPSVSRVHLNDLAHKASISVKELFDLAKNNSLVRQRYEPRNLNFQKCRLKSLTGTMRLAVLCPDSLGDLVLRQPLFKALLSRGCDITVAARPSSVNLLPFIDSRLKFIQIGFNPYFWSDDPTYTAAISRFLEEIKAGHFDSILCPLFNRTLADDIVLQTFPSTIRIGFAPGTSPAIPAQRYLAQNAIPSSLENLFSIALPVAKEWQEIQKYQSLLQEVFDLKLTKYSPRLTITKKEKNAAASCLKTLGLKKKSFAISCPIGGANVQLKAVPSAISIAIAKYLTLKHHLPTLFVGTEAERPQLEELKTASNKAGAITHIWTSQTDELGYLLGLISQARIYVGADTGPMHMAGALGIPVSAIMGGGTYPRFLPVAPDSFIAVNELDCFGCSWDCPYDSPLCLHSINPDSVIDGTKILLQNNHNWIKTLTPSWFR